MAVPPNFLLEALAKDRNYIYCQLMQPLALPKKAHQNPESFVAFLASRAVPIFRMWLVRLVGARHRFHS